MKDVRISDLKERVRLERVTRSDDGGGGASETWTPIAEFWAAVIPVQSAEALRSEQVSGETRHHVICRYRDDIRVRDRAVIGARYLNIRGVFDAGDEAKFLKLVCEETIA